MSSLPDWPRKAANIAIMSDSNCPAFELSKMQDKKLLTLCWGLFLGYGNERSTCPLTRKTSHTFTLLGCDHLAIWLQIVKDYESLTLHWRSHYTQPNWQCKLNHGSSNVYWNYWQSIVLFYILFFASRCFVAPHHLIHYFLRDMSDKWCSHIAFQRFQPAIWCMQTWPLIFD